MPQIGGSGVRLSAQVRVQHLALTQAPFLFWRQSVPFPEPGRRVRLVLFVPVARHLLIVLIKLVMVSSVSIVLPTTILCQKPTPRDGEYCGDSSS